MKPHCFFSLCINSFPFVREYRLRKKLQLKRKRIYDRLHRERNKQLKRYLQLSNGIHRF